MEGVIIELVMMESDIVRAIKNPKFSPLHYLASRIFKEIPDNIDATKSGILVWDDELNDYTNYKYCVEDINKIAKFVEGWEDFIEENAEEFNESLISFFVEKLN